MSWSMVGDLREGAVAGPDLTRLAAPLRSCQSHFEDVDAVKARREEAREGLNSAIDRTE